MRWQSLRNLDTIIHISYVHFTVSSKLAAAYVVTVL